MKVKEDNFKPDWDFDSNIYDTNKVYAEQCTSNIVDWSFASTEHLLNIVKRINKICERIPDKILIENLPEEILCKMFEQASLLSRALRESFSSVSVSDHSELKKKYKDTLNIFVSKPENTIIRIKMLPLINKPLKGTYNVYDEVKIALEEYKKEHRIDVPQGERFTLIYKKYSKSFASNYTCDNDNFEMKRVTNAITESIHRYDNVHNFSFYYTTVLAKKNYVEATVIKENDLANFIEYITKAE